jgi:hypothetical protein
VRPLGRHDEASRLLSDVYGWFTEGFDTPDLKVGQGTWVSVRATKHALPLAEFNRATVATSGLKSLPFSMPRGRSMPIIWRSRLCAGSSFSMRQPVGYPTGSHRGF